MTIEPGQLLIHYRLTEKIGQGGMGVVWKAVDTTLDREVAIKILPREFAEDTERLARFEREAKLLASLNHPHIAAVYGLHQASTDDGPVRVLALELVEGEDLQRQLERGLMPVDQALDIAVQIAEGVDAAHKKGVVHRDLKPANVVRSPEGKVKVLDFGLAKSFMGESGATSGSADLAMSPTMTSVGTIQGVILGTANYMSPEQARGRLVDQRTDVWAFGCVLFELLCGAKPFGGDTLTDVLAAIVRAEPDWNALAGRVPESVIDVLQGVRVENGGALQADLSDNGMLVYAPSGATMGTRLTWVDRQGNTEAVNHQWRPYSWPSVSPNGERIAAVVNDGGRNDVWIVDVASGGMARLTTSGNASAPVWTPKGGAITFVEETPPSFAIRTVPVESSGQGETLLTSEHQMTMVAWHPDGNGLVFLEKSGGNGNLFVLDVSSGTRTALLDPDLNISAASLSPDGRRLAYCSNKTGKDEVYVGPFPGPGAEVLVSVDGGRDPIWSPDGSELFYREARRFGRAKLDDLRVSDRGPVIDAVHFWQGGDIDPQTERFLVLKKNEDQLRPGIHVILNWFDELERAAPHTR